MKLTEYRVQYKIKGEWCNADFTALDNIENAIERCEMYREGDKYRGAKWEYRIVTRVVDYGEWVEAWT